MAQLSITVPDNKVTKLVDAFCEQEGYADFIWNPDTSQYDLPNPQSKNNFARDQVKKYFVGAYIRKQSEIARNAATVTAQNEV